MSANPNRPDASPPKSLGRAREWALLAIVAAACLTPFLDKAFHIDDHRYLGIARQVVQDPFDFYGFDVSFGNSEQPFAPLANNPPLIGFYMAAAASLVGWSEPGLHAAFALLAIAALFAVWSVARRLCDDPLLAALLCLSFPAFLLSATTVMAVVGMLACFCAAVACWLKGLAEQRFGWLMLGAGFAALSALTKYFGLALVPLLLAYGLVRERRLGTWALPLLLTLGILAAYEFYTTSVYGVSPIASAMGYSVTTRPEATPVLQRVVVALVFTGGVLAPVLLYAGLCFTRRMALSTLALGLLAFGLWGHELDAFGAELDTNLLLHGLVFALAGAALPVLIVSDLFRRRDANSLLLALWAVGGFVFAAIVNYTTNGRSVLPMAPPVAILVVRQLQTREGLRGRWRHVLLVPCLALSLAIAVGDAALANAARIASRHITDRYAALPGTLWSETSWGFQHYMTEWGARRIDVRTDVMKPGDHLARPLNWKSLLAPPSGSTTVVERLALPMPIVTTMQQDSDTGFYAIQWGPLPFRIQPGYAERFEVHRAESWILFEGDPDLVRRRRAELDQALDLVSVLRVVEAPAEAPECADGLLTLQRVARDACGGCASVDACFACYAQEAGATVCAARLRALVAAQLARCIDEFAGDDAAVGDVCRAALAEREALLRAPAPRAR